MTTYKDAVAITQVTATGQSDAIATEQVDGVLRAQHLTIYIQHVNGTGTISAGASIVVQVQPADSSTWYAHKTLTGNTTASDTETWTQSLPADTTKVRIDYTAPSGSTGHTLDAEVGRGAT